VTTIQYICPTGSQSSSKHKTGDEDNSKGTPINSSVRSSWLAIVMPGDEAQPRNAVGIIGRIEPFVSTVSSESGRYVIHKQIYHVVCHLNLIQIHRILLIS
jgi:hypothetical protein